jgi:hypothetical protein
VSECVPNAANWDKKCLEEWQLSSEALSVRAAGSCFQRIVHVRRASKFSARACGDGGCYDSTRARKLAR